MLVVWLIMPCCPGDDFVGILSALTPLQMGLTNNQKKTYSSEQFIQMLKVLTASGGRMEYYQFEKMFGTAAVQSWLDANHLYFIPASAVDLTPTVRPDAQKDIITVNSIPYLRAME